MKTRIRTLTEVEKRSLGEKQMIIDWCKEFPTGILSIVADTFDLWKLITEYLTDPEVKAAILARDGKLVIRPDSGDPVDIVCGLNTKEGFLESLKDEVYQKHSSWFVYKNSPEVKGVIELLWDIFGGTVNAQGYKVLDSHIGAIYGDSINLERQVQIYERLAAKGFAATNIVVGVGSYTYIYNTRDNCGFAAKGAWFEVGAKNPSGDTYAWKHGYNIYKDPVTDDGTKKSLKGLLCVVLDDSNGVDEMKVLEECTPSEENQGLLQVIYENGEFHHQTTLNEIRQVVSANF